MENTVRHLKAIGIDDRSEIQNFGKDSGLIHEAILTGKKVNAGREFWSRLAHNQELFEEVHRQVMGGYIETSAQSHARRIMGDRFFGIDDVLKVYGIGQFKESPWSARELDYLGYIPYSSAVLDSCKATHVLFPGIGEQVQNLPLDLREQLGRRGSWPVKGKVSVRWYLLRTKLLAASFGWQEYEKLFDTVSDKEEIARPCEVAYAWMLRLVLRQLPLFDTEPSNIFGLTSEIRQNDKREKCPTAIGHHRRDFELCVDLPKTPYRAEQLQPDYRLCTIVKPDQYTLG